jgi:hypothetical protein
VPSQCLKTEPSVLGYGNATLKHLFNLIKRTVGVKKECDIDVVSTNHL